MTFQDIFKKTFLENVQDLSLPNAITSLIVALLLGILIFLTYQYAFSGMIYNKNFNVSLVAVTVITSVIVITLATNIVLSLGMVGALSIVRFRTAVKEPLDVVYMFWAITTGIVCGAGLRMFALLTVLIVAAIFFLMRFVKYDNNKYIMVINCDKEAWPQVQSILDKTHYITRTKTINLNDIEIVIELDLKKDRSTFVNQVSEIENVHQVSLVNYKSSL